MEKRIIGKVNSVEVSEIGMGCMGFSHGYGPAPSKDDAIRLIRYAHERGCTFFDTAEGYGNGENEKLVGEAINPFRNSVVLATKLHLPDTDNPEKEIREHLRASLKRLGTDYVDIYYLHRINRNIMLEDISAAMGKLIEDGLIRGWGLSEVNGDEIRRAHSVTPLTAVQNEYSLMERKYEADAIPACAELGIGFVPFSPLGAGFLSGSYSSRDNFKGDDVRRVITRFDKTNMDKNGPILSLLDQIGRKKGGSKAQIALSWMISKYDFLVPIPGMRRKERIDENLGAASFHLTAEEITELENEMAKLTIYGNRTDEDIFKLKDILRNEESNGNSLQL